MTRMMISELKPQSDFDFASVSRAVRFSKRTGGTHCAGGNAIVGAVEGIRHVGEKIDIFPRISAAGVLADEKGFRNVETEVQKPWSYVLIAPYYLTWDAAIRVSFFNEICTQISLVLSQGGASRTIVDVGVAVAVVAGRDGVEVAAVGVHRSRKKYSHEQLRIHGGVELMHGIRRPGPIRPQIVIVGCSAEVIIAVVVLGVVSVACIDVEDAETL